MIEPEAEGDMLLKKWDRITADVGVLMDVYIT